ncbi:solute carrier family 12 member 6-like [Dendronephthya gigantea]|uniref:solute carrier family 12 member 6-like n=1 Tax=Dendronephthya gigantea TaxID=151771 RepID=UPI00106B09C2|nr:solute carrier family 12 member 6-like [Dendronephthya gigantea]
MSARFVVSKTDSGVPEAIQESAEDTKNVEIIVEGDKELDGNTNIRNNIFADVVNEDESHLPLYNRQEAETAAGTLPLYEADMLKRPKISILLSQLASYEAVQAAPMQVDQEGKTALKRKEGAKMGTLMGVYFPTIQNIFGVILFIRLSWIVGIAGAPEAFLIVLTCCCCTLLTSISMSAIATNGVVPAGGSYFMISRALGPEFGGAVGILFYLGTTFASSMYTLGAIEILLTYIAPGMSLFGDVRSSGGATSSVMLNNMRVYGTILLFLLAVVVFIGVKVVNKCASLFLACVLLSIFATYIGFFTVHTRSDTRICMLGDRLLASKAFSQCSKNDTDIKKLFQDSSFWNASRIKDIDGAPGLSSGVFDDNVDSQYLDKSEVHVGQKADNDEEVQSDSKTSFFILLAIFFPSVTGIMAGSNRSGDLKDAQRSIPKGTIAAILTTSTVYLTSVLFFAGTIKGALLRDKFGQSIGSVLLVAEIAWPSKWVILIGALLSTIGAGMQSLTGAPRLLQAISRDNLIPFLNLFSYASKNGEPTRALFLTVAIAEIGILVANLDAVAPIITMFFLMCYGFVNLACVLQSLLQTPNWRPRFKFYHWFASLIGLCLCLTLMFVSSWYYALVALIVAAGIYKYIEFQGAKKEWGDGIRGLALSAARYGLLRLEEGAVHTKNWRPQLLVLCKLNDDLKPKTDNIFAFVGQLKAGRGLTISASVLKGDILERSEEVEVAKACLDELMKNNKVQGFSKVIVSNEINSGLSFLIQNNGLGGLTANSVLMAWPENWKEKDTWKKFVYTLRVISKRHEALLVAKNLVSYPGNGERLEGTIDIWWVVHDGGMMILLVFLLTQHKVWRQCKLRIFTVAQMQDNSVQMAKDLKTFIYQLRIKADVEVIEMVDTDIEAYTYERTLVMEQRSKMLKKMRLTRKESRKEVQAIVETHHKTKPSNTPRPPDTPVPSIQVHTSSSTDTSEKDGEKRKKEHPSKMNLQRMDNAVKLNKLIQEKSSEAQLLLLNLPPPAKNESGDYHYMEFVEVMTEGLKRVLLVKGSGHEVITIYS